eukprot:MONOS_3632.1-p1 / transcript=MONOS_3632.1 / gene=MONOS_3632 / organism=Monocercomonoides_exilis_PA203 / gene_product=Pre-mRNA-processing factor 17 / transcript_product=Pre-mRNA-processing factor 17 / location=Mono_scaffold00087:43629-45020(+) / protein_length=342 / sequence_SO=supercontig / SO=protein_coding / is_pseudo=false
MEGKGRKKKKEIPVGQKQCNAPRRCIRDWKAHNGAASAIDFFPQSAHLLLSAGLADGRIKIWDVADPRRGCLRTMDIGTAQQVSSAAAKSIKQAGGGLRDACFVNGGTQVCCVGYDGFLRQWDTETGICMARFSSGSTPICVAHHARHPTVVMCGTSAKCTDQWDLRVKHRTQKYEYHLKDVRNVTFLRGGSRFTSMSDDKSIKFWDYGIPVPIKQFADEQTKAVTDAALHPSGTFFVAQTMGNKIVTFSAVEGFGMVKHQTFEGHNSAGFSIGVDFSPDGSYVIGGDSDGTVHLWEWNRPKIHRSLFKAHESVCCGVKWNPTQPSQVVTCGWDGHVKLWE